MLVGFEVLCATTAELQKGDRVLDLFCGVGLLGLSMANAMKARKAPLRAVEGYEVYNQSVNDARSNGKLLGFGKKANVVFKSADLSQPTLGAKTHCDVAICGEAFQPVPS